MIGNIVRVQRSGNGLTMGPRRASCGRLAGRVIHGCFVLLYVCVLAAASQPPTRTKRPTVVCTLYSCVTVEQFACA